MGTFQVDTKVFNTASILSAEVMSDYEVRIQTVTGATLYIALYSAGSAEKFVQAFKAACKNEV